MVSLPKESVEIPRPTSPLLPQYAATAYSDEKSEDLNVYSDDPNNNNNTPFPTQPSSEVPTTRYQQIQAKFSGLSKIKKIFLTLIAVWFSFGLIHKGMRFVSHHHRGHHGGFRGGRGRGGKGRWESMGFNFEPEVPTTSTYPYTASFDDASVSTASVTFDTTKSLTINYPLGSTGKVYMTISEDITEATLAIQTTSDFSVNAEAPQEIEVSTISSGSFLLLAEGESKVHNIVLSIPSTINYIQSLSLSGEDLSFQIDATAGLIEFGELNVITSSGDVILSPEQDGLITVGGGEFKSDTGDIKGSFNVSRELVLKTTTGNISAKVSVFKPHRFPGHGKKPHFPFPPHHHHNGSFPHHNGTWPHHNGSFPHHNGTWPHKNGSFPHPPPPHKGPGGPPPHGPPHHKGPGGPPPPPPHKGPKKGEESGFMRRWFGHHGHHEEDREAQDYEFSESENDEERFEMIEDEEDDSEERFDDEKDTQSPPPPPPHKGKKGPKGPGGPGKGPKGPPPHRGPKHHKGPCHGPPPPPPVSVTVMSITGSISLEYVSHPANVSLISRAFSKTGSVDVKLAEEYQGKFKAGAKIGSLEIANPNEKKAIITKEMKSSTGAFVEGFVKKVSSNVTAFEEMIESESEEEDDERSTWMQLSAEFEHHHARGRHGGFRGEGRPGPHFGGEHFGGGRHGGPGHRGPESDEFDGERREHHGFGGRGEHGFGGRRGPRRHEDDFEGPPPPPHFPPPPHKGGKFPPPPPGGPHDGPHGPPHKGPGGPPPHKGPGGPPPPHGKFPPPPPGFGFVAAFTEVGKVTLSL